MLFSQVQTGSATAIVVTISGANVVDVAANVTKLAGLDDVKNMSEPSRNVIPSSMDS